MLLKKQVPILHDDARQTECAQKGNKTAWITVIHSPRMAPTSPKGKERAMANCCLKELNRATRYPGGMGMDAANKIHFSKALP
jgi:hypothetical protein